MDEEDDLDFYFREHGSRFRVLYFADFVTDCQVLLEVPIEQLSQAAQSLTEYPGFLSTLVIESIVGRYIVQNDNLRRFVRVIQWVERYLRTPAGTLENLEHTLSQWAKREENQKAWTVQRLGQVNQAIQALRLPYPGQSKQAKAERLGAAVRHRVHQIELICDLRPVFNEDRTVVEGLIPFTVMRIGTLGDEGLPVVFEVVLSARDVQTLHQKTEGAVSKLNTLGNLAAKYELPIPAIDLTETQD